MKNMFNNLGTAPKLQIEVGATKWTEKQTLTILDLSFYKPFKPLGDLMITGFCYLAFIWKLLVSLPSIISGAGGFVGSSIDLHQSLEIKDVKSFTGGGKK